MAATTACLTRRCCSSTGWASAKRLACAGCQGAPEQVHVVWVLRVERIRAQGGFQAVFLQKGFIFHAKCGQRIPGFCFLRVEIDCVTVGFQCGGQVAA